MRTQLLIKPVLLILVGILAIAPVGRIALAQIDEADLTDLVSTIDFDGNPGEVRIAVYEPDGTVTTAAAAEGLPAGDEPSVDDLFRVGSITKIFTATLVLTLVAEGSVDLDAPAADYITRLPIPNDITVRQLLNHTSGLPEYVNYGALQDQVMGDPGRIWSPEEIWSLIADKPVGDPGESFEYASTNYIALGVLIEEVTGESYADVLSERILQPLNMDDSYLAGFQDGPDPAPAFMAYNDITIPIIFDYTAIATIAWAAGGLVSTGADLHTFMTALFAGEVIPDDLLAEMTDTSSHQYGLGLASDPAYPDFYGHSGATPGYATLIAHSAKTGVTVFWAATNEAISFGPTVDPILEALSGANATPVAGG